MAWIQVAVAEKNGNTFSKTLLLNTEKVGDIQASDSVAEFWYEDHGKTTAKYKTSSLTKDQLITLVSDSTLYDERIEIPALGRSLVKRNKLNDLDLFASETVVNVDADKLIDAWDIGSTSTCYARFELGNKSILYKVDDTIANLESASSTSVSIA